MKTVTIHVVGFSYPDWSKRVPETYDILLDVRNFIGRGNKRKKGGASALRSKAIRDELMAKKGTQDCINYLAKKIVDLQKAKCNLVIVIGCKQGKHRSVTVALALQEMFASDVIYHYTK